MLLSCEEMFDRSLGGVAREREIPHWAGNILYVLVAFFCKLLWRYKVSGICQVRALKGHEGAVLASNHTSYLDVAFIYAAMRPFQWPRFMARDTLFESGGRLGSQIMARVGAFPVKRDSADRTSLKRAARMLKNKEIVCIFPEGTRRAKGSKDAMLHAGMALVAKMGDAPIVPCGLTNVDRIKRKGERVHFPQVLISFGDPVYYDWFEFLPKEERLEACTWYVMRECFALSMGVPPDEVDMDSLFPHAKNFSEKLLDDTFLHCVSCGSRRC